MTPQLLFPYIAGGMIGFLVGVLVTILVYGTIRAIRNARMRRARRAKFKRWAAMPAVPNVPKGSTTVWRPGPTPGNASRHPRSGTISDYLDGERARPFNPDPGPRDW